MYTSHSNIWGERGKVDQQDLTLGLYLLWSLYQGGGSSPPWSLHFFSTCQSWLPAALRQWEALAVNKRAWILNKAGCFSLCAGKSLWNQWYPFQGSSSHLVTPAPGVPLSLQAIDGRNFHCWKVGYFVVLSLVLQLFFSLCKQFSALVFLCF